MIKINLLDEVKAASKEPGIGPPSERKPSAGPEQQKKNIIFGAEIGIALLIVGVWYFSLSSKLGGLESQKREKELELKKVEALIQEVERYRERKALLEKQINLIEELKTQQQGPADLMKRLYDLMPDQIFLKTLEKKDNTISIDGISLSDPALSSFYKNLDESPYFDGIEPGKSLRKNEGINFDLSCRFIIDPAREKMKQEQEAAATKPNRRAKK
ncbi:MAG: PilN domain-containing protein [Acidobacteria bacterium]|nr:PilN domain-containing protein [Acidobacteriota bacterium]